MGLRRVSLVEKLSKSVRGMVEAPAGCGKTQHIAEAVKAIGRRELVLTHTHAGVDAIRRRLRKLGAKSGDAHVDTLAGFALRYVSAFPSTSGVSIELPETSEDWKTIHLAAANLLRVPQVQKIIRSSYSGVFVDEYQDCLVEQHKLVLSLADLLPCRLFGDPLQAIFGFKDNELIEWDSLCSDFELLGTLKEPWRWNDGNKKLGQWLLEAREIIIAGDPLRLAGAPLAWRTLQRGKSMQQQQLGAAQSVANLEGSMVAIGSWEAQCHKFARNMKGRLHSIETMECQDLRKHAQQIDAGTGAERVEALVDFADACLTKAKSEMKTIRGAIARGKYVARGYKPQRQYLALRAVAEQNSPNADLEALLALRALPGAVLGRRELFDEMCTALRAYAAGETESLLDAGVQARERTRRIGRYLGRCVVGRTVLVKGLEFEHGLLLDADAFTPKNLYVALTRASSSLTILSSTDELVTAQNGGK